MQIWREFRGTIPKCGCSLRCPALLRDGRAKLPPRRARARLGGRAEGWQGCGVAWVNHPTAPLVRGSVSEPLWVPLCQEEGPRGAKRLPFPPPADDWEVSAEGSGGFQPFTPSVQGVAHVDCGQWLRSGLSTSPGSPPAQGCCWPGDGHPWSGNTCVPYGSVEFFLLRVSRETRRSCRQAGLACHHRWMWHCPVQLRGHH